MTTQSADVIIVGGGIMGSATAFFLRQRGVSVILLERGLVGQQASGVNFGNVRRQGRFLPQLPLANRSGAIWRKLPELIGEDVEYLQSGHIRVCYSPERIGFLEQHVRDARDYGLELEMVSAAGLRSRFPFFAAEAVAGSYSPEDGHANPRLAAPAFARAAQRKGAQVFENTEIAEIEKNGVDFRATATDGRTFTAPSVLIAAGAWGDKMCAKFGEPVPLIVRGPQMGVTEPVPYTIKPAIGVSSEDPTDSIYFRQVKRGNIVFGGCLRGPAFADARRSYVNPDSTLHQLKQLTRVAPSLAKVSVIRVWSGIESYLPDDIPIMGPSARVPGLHYAFGFCGAGFQLGPGVGDVMAELIHTGSTTTPIEPFLISRFATQAEPEHEVEGEER
jgi:sarcosine oxidase subunit beta